MTVTILDGGMGQELVKRSVAIPTPLWATQLMIDSPDMVGEVHDDYFTAGADICTTNTYAVHHDRLLKSGKMKSLNICIKQLVELQWNRETGLVQG
jgi:homocysteine S-methyltransferase